MPRPGGARGTGSRSSTTEVRSIFDRRAEGYDRGIAFWERWFFGDGRQWVCSRANGRTLELAVGTGRNLPYYRPGVRVVGLELSFPMVAIASQRAADAGIAVALVEGDAQFACFRDESFDSVVCTLSLSFIPNDRAAIVEAHRVLAPGGCLIVLDHVRSHLWPIAWAETVIEPLWQRFDPGDHLTRRPPHVATEVGFRVESVERSRLGVVECFVARKA